MNDYVTIDGKNYSKEIIGLVTGNQNIDIELEKIPACFLMLCEVIDNPYKLPYFLETFYSMDIDDENTFRFSLVRVQVDSDLRMNEDIQKHQQRRYVARTVEKLMYHEVMLELMEGVEFNIEE
ncbi:MAG: hypothetical protein JXA98_04020 [Methanosarcinaceae archaeon]|nr:hypothetical protein [Methanosarcinaceae archaeon]